MGRNNFMYVILALLITFTFSNCDTYEGRKKIVAELSSLYNENQTEFDLIVDYFSKDSLPKFFVLENVDDKIEIDINNNVSILDSIEQIKDDQVACRIVTFMQEKKIRAIYGYGNGNINIFFKDNKLSCFNFIYQFGFNPNDEDVKKQIESIKDPSFKAWIYVLDKKGWYIEGTPCFS